MTQEHMFNSNCMKMPARCQPRASAGMGMAAIGSMYESQSVPSRYLRRKRALRFYADELMSECKRAANDVLVAMRSVMTEH